MPVEECERMIESLKEFKVVEVGSSVYLSQFNNLQVSCYFNMRTNWNEILTICRS